MLCFEAALLENRFCRYLEAAMTDSMGFFKRTSRSFSSTSGKFDQCVSVYVSVSKCQCVSVLPWKIFLSRLGTDFNIYSTGMFSLSLLRKQCTVASNDLKSTRTGPFAPPFARSLAPLALHCSLQTWNVGSLSSKNHLAL